MGVTLAHPWSDGTRAVVFAPLEFLEKLAALIPRPRINLVIRHGVLAAHARGRARRQSLAQGQQIQVRTIGSSARAW